ncbi:hypothetical protein BU23DRAFT_29312 [Bimuria novae-zelandiae CBS 107.79]|uniref:Uncharacterized protein n=1 Tax=Bimuria novae-zelandiae CBS 107.79 TaxID=1447943 RepID=A0A6A5VH67_9PLEO|nr:hypothetical protein BU23DRAFT_29312 [Bimuria novae-zelandiae CBS 107.79]
MRGSGGLVGECRVSKTRAGASRGRNKGAAHQTQKTRARARRRWSKSMNVGCLGWCVLMLAVASRYFCTRRCALLAWIT